ncbi:MAG: three-Cys-motif partner protein TcmP [Nannocystaceae bacterium]|nr:three-Cys-motif partner protein TcmP [Nannocystaceae bacterium]
MTEMPNEYEGREQSFLKHCVLKEYLLEWGIKIGSRSRDTTVTLWYVDCFSGPWKSQSQTLQDTSIHIGLNALESAAEVWQKKGTKVETRAIFVEKNAEAHAQLQDYLDQRSGSVKAEALHGEFGDQVAAIRSRLGTSAAFIFVDPTGFNGVAMKYIAALTEPRMRDVLVNVMYNDINRFKDDGRDFLREQFREFFGESLPTGLDEVGLMDLYRKNLKAKCGLRFAADLAIPHKTSERTWFRLVVGGKSPAAIELFRRVEANILSLIHI